MQPQFYSQHHEDCWIVEHLELPEKGMFVEVGAYDGVNLSNTFHFEQKGWTGLCIEADPRQWHKLLVNRTCEKFFGAVGTRRDVIFNQSDIPSHSGFGRQGPGVKVPVLPLHVLIDAYALDNIDILSLDTEGTELEVLESGFFGWGAYPGVNLYPRIVIIEHDTAGLPSAKDAIRERFARLPYREVHENVGNLIFQRIDKAEGH